MHSEITKGMSPDMAADACPPQLPLLDGKITVGPISLPRRWTGIMLQNHMKEFGLRVHSDEGAHIIGKPSLGGFTIQADGPGVLGYLVDAEGLDAEDTDLELFAVPFLGGLPFTITGEHDLGGGKLLRCATKIEASPDAIHGVVVTRTRVLLKT